MNEHWRRRARGRGGYNHVTLHRDLIAHHSLQGGGTQNRSRRDIEPASSSCSATPLTGQPFPGNVIPASRINPNGLAILNLMSRLHGVNGITDRNKNVTINGVGIIVINPNLEAIGGTRVRSQMGTPSSDRVPVAPADASE